MSVPQDYLATPPPRRFRFPLRTVLIVIGVFLVVVLAALGAYAYGLSASFDSAKRFEKSFPAEADRPAATDDASQNILLIGSDAGGPGSDPGEVEGTRSDTMMVIHVSGDRESVHVMSLMKDSWVEIPGHGQDRLNTALVLGGVPLAVQTVEGVLDARIDRVASVDFEGFAGITDALGGVQVNNEVPFRSFDKGPITLNGKQALEYVRETDSFTDGDIQRLRNQQAFVKGLMAKFLSAETLTNPGKITELMSAATPYLEVDSGFSSGYAVGLGFELRNLRMDDVTFFTLPVIGPADHGGEVAIDVDWNQVAVVRDHFREDTLDEYRPVAQP
ncbi:LytR family transcriptional regulator [Mycetocola manganoxydans]|uniref:LytR family transcriptional regulator n=1 Tax=Mycetocola manganoxydans TaxID=699879 RepID=A0A3L7A0A9_9MICO|nr:LCP family protein [Mycetocola manganoxydans]RLP73428.1 LytR family transcriptional regulator [Mycetocola manganoxydans]GHD41753.1 transcriptional regulator [Mycetocola manganoxydans]